MRNKLSDWLEKLQQESWQLELLISGFLLSFVLGLKEPLEELLSYNTGLLNLDFTGAMIFLFLLVLLVGWYILAINLCVHVLLRSFWIGTIGLRNVSGDINIDNLKLSPRFEEHLRKKMPTYDIFIERLENFCCLIFAFTFIIIFAILGLFFYLFFFIGVVYFLSIFFINHLHWNGVFKIIIIPFSFSYLLFGFIYFIDFIALSSVKRVKWLSRFYLPFYRFFNWITLSSIYRPLYYNMVDNPLGRKVMWSILPYVGFLLLYGGAKVRDNEFFPDNSDSVYAIKYNFYEDTQVEKDSREDVTIASRYVEDDGFLEVYISNRIFKSLSFSPCMDSITLKPKGIYFFGDFNVGFNSEKKEEDKKNGLVVGKAEKESDDNSKDKKILDCLASHMKISISDSLINNYALDFYEHPQTKQKGYLVILDVKNLKRGRHLLSLSTLDKSAKEKVITKIPFWKK